MTREDRFTTRIPGVLVPRSLLSAPERFGGIPAGDCLAGDLIVTGGHAVALEPSDTPASRLVLPRLTEPHVHLDKCHSIDRMQGVGGDLQAAIAAQRADKATWTEDNIHQRAKRGILELAAAGCGTVRSHVDWSECTGADQPPLAWHVLDGLAEGTGIALQRAALTGVDQMVDPGYARRCAARIAGDGAVLGSFVLGQPERAQGIANCFREADRLGLALDFHVDEGLEPGLDGLEMIADAALEIGFEGPVLCGHACGLANRSEDDLARIADKLARAGIAVAALPQTNLYLQGRRAGTPDRRGITRVKELQAAGVTVAMGADNVRDAFCPIGRHDPISVLSLGVLAAHLDPPFGDHLPMITTNARRALGLAPQTVDGAAIGDLLLFDAPSTSDLLSGAARPHPLVETPGVTP